MTLSNGLHREVRQKRADRIFYCIGLCAACVLLNLLASRLPDQLHIPLYLDVIGILIASMLAGYLPGIIVGYLSNMLGWLNDPLNIYYGVISVLIAVATTWFYHKGYFRSVRKLILPIISLALIGGGLGSILTWLMYGFSFGMGISAPLAHSIYNQGTLSMFWSQFAADMLIDLLDKTISVCIAAGVVFLVPAVWKSKFDFENWAEVSKSMARRKRRIQQMYPHQNILTRSFSLRGKVVLMITAAILVISIATAGISIMQYHRATIDDHIKLAQGVASLAARSVDPERVDEYIEKGYEAQGYQDVEDDLYSLRESSSDIQYVYVYRILSDGCHVVFDLDTEDLPGSEPGEIVPFDASFIDYIPTLLKGGEIRPLITNDTYGWLMTVYKPVYDSAGKCQCYAAVDISMRQISLQEAGFITKVISLFLSFFLLILALGLHTAQAGIITPINTMAEAADEFAYTTEEARKDSVEHFKKLDISTGDEIENLYHSFSKTITDTMGYIESVEQQGEVISRMQNGLIMVLADMVESRDKCTGDHVRKTAAYTQIIMDQMRKEGKYKDQLTDEFVEDVVNSAPLHDVGKIQVPDSLLNKPGKLTDEEFKRMQSHTTAGGDVISEAIALVSDSGYLLEARNLAMYHHERWDGKGYPTGLKGEEIPLSARIMAVADVFDALVSKRSYKEPFSFEKAMSIIKEESGTHFDPVIVEAFVHAEDELRRVSQLHMDGNIIGAAVK